LDIPFINKEKIASLLTMQDCILVMEKMFRSLANGESTQPLRSLMWLPDKKGLLGMMPGYDKTAGVMGIKLISVFHGNKDKGYPSHQGVVVLFDANNGQPLMIFDASEITALRTAAASALATKLLSRENSELLSIIGSGEQAERHIESILLVRKITQINVWSRNEKNASNLAIKISDRYNVPIIVNKKAAEAVKDADIICTVTSSPEPVVLGDWIKKGTHINAVGSSTPATRELDTNAVLKAKLYTDCYESILNEAGDFLIPKKEGVITDEYIQGDLGEVLLGTKNGREDQDEVTLFKSLGIASEDIFSCWHIYQKINQS
jgi:ornithine cyclodeaminase/alanine dehydrogenase-like protein (mu-crystallin family)